MKKNKKIVGWFISFLSRQELYAFGCHFIFVKFEKLNYLVNVNLYFYVEVTGSCRVGLLFSSFSYLVVLVGIYVIFYSLIFTIICHFICSFILLYAFFNPILIILLSSYGSIQK